MPVLYILMSHDCGVVINFSAAICACAENESITTSRQGPDRIFEGVLSSICLNFCTSGNHGMFATSFVLLYSVLSWEYPILRFNCTYLYFMQETGEMSVVVADFGLARVLRDRPASPKNYVTSTNWSPSNTSRPLLIPGHKPPPPKKR